MWAHLTNDVTDAPWQELEDNTTGTICFIDY